MTPLEFNLPLKVNANARGHSRFGPRIRVGAEKVSYRKLAVLVIGGKLRGLAEREPAGLLVTLTRVAPRPLDAHDNGRTAMKPIADAVTDALGLKSDRDPRLSFAYDQQRAGIREYSVLVRVESRPPPCPTCGAYSPSPRISL